MSLNTGANLHLLPKGSHLVMLDPNESFKPLLEKNLKAHPSLQMERFVLGKAEEMSAVSDESVDAVVCTLVLCSVDKIPAVLSEVRRVLVPVSLSLLNKLRTTRTSHVPVNSLSFSSLFLYTRRAASSFSWST